MLQLHGEEGPVYCEEARRRTGLHVIKAARVRDSAAVRALSAYRTDFHLLDAHVVGERGGTGETFDWSLAAEHRGKPPLILSGGLTPDNVQEAIATVRPFAVDVASGVEAVARAQGPEKLRRFFEAVRAARRPRSDGDPGARAALRPLRRPLRSRDADAGARRARAGLARGSRRTAVRDRLDAAAAALRRPADAAVRADAPVGARRRPRLPEARGPASHGRAQDQQCARPGAARPAHGQAARDRRDRRGPARCRDRDRVRAARARLRRLHGDRGHEAPAPERRAHGAARSRGRAGRGRRPHAQGGGQRGDPRLGHERRRRPIT